MDLLKSARSLRFFRKTKVNSCQFVTKKNGQTIAISFKDSNKGKKAKEFWKNQTKSIIKKSHSRETYKVNKSTHVGMARKPLIKYDPNCFRSRLPSLDYVAPYRNLSQLEIGNRIRCSPKTVFKTSYQALLVSNDMLEGLTNQGIIAEKTKWHKKRVLD